MLHDAWAILQAVADQTQDRQRAKPEFLPPHADAKAGFIVGGTSLGANFADAVAHRAG